jgi:hypothetical protein
MKHKTLPGKMLIVGLVMLLTTACSTTPPTPKAGSWDGKPDVVLEIAQDGKIENFQITVPFPPSTCTLTATAIPIQADGAFTITWSIPEFQGAFENTVTGKVENDSRLTGPYLVQNCRNSVQSPASKGTWTAAWKNP